MEAIAIVGMACRYPGARSPADLWANVLAQRTAFRRIPEERLRVADYNDPEDRIATDTAAVIEDYNFDRERYRVSAQTYRAADLSHWLALDVATKALEDAGMGVAGDALRQRTAVFVGNTLTGEFSRANTLRLRWPYVRRVLHSVLSEEESGVPEAARRRFFERTEALFKAPFPATGDESLAGGLSNTIAGRICNHHDFKGGGYTLDGACASSLLAVTGACAALRNGEVDLALAGGVDLSIDPFELAGFSVLGALAKEKMRIYDAGSSGFWPGEGSGFVVLARHEEAIARGQRVYAVIRGWGISSDGRGGIARPEVEGQLLALERAYERAGYGADTVAYFEGHGTGTAVGDATELQALSRMRRKANPDAGAAALGSIKANIGHTKAAAGIAGVIKAALAVHAQIIPPTTGCDVPHPDLLLPRAGLRIVRQGITWPEDCELRAGVSAMGFGGINAHVTLEGAGDRRRAAVTSKEENQIGAHQDCELFLLSGRKSELQARVKQLADYAARLSRSELTDLAEQLSRGAETGPVRAALCASTPAQLHSRLKILDAWLELEEKAGEHLDADAGVFLSGEERVASIGFLFSGQASPVYGWNEAWTARFPFLRDLYEDAKLPERPGTATASAQPCIVASSLAGLRVMEKLGLQAQVAVGHSLGEICALHWAGTLSEGATMRVAAARGQAMAGVRGAAGAMAAIECGCSTVESLLNGSGVQIAAMNSPRQTVISGEAAGVEAMIARSRAQGIAAKRLNVSHAFHSRLLSTAAPALLECLEREKLNTPVRRLVSTINGTELTTAEGLGDLLCQQLDHPVRFQEAFARVSEGCDLWIEVGPGQVLTGIARQCTDRPVVALDAGGESFAGVLKAAGAAYVLGYPLSVGRMFEGRFTRGFDLAWKATFFANPCDAALAPVEACLSRVTSPGEQTQANGETALHVLQKLIAARTELPEAVVQPGSGLLRDLHLNSISVSQLIVEAAQRMNIRTPPGIVDYSVLTVGEAAEALELNRSHSSGVEPPERLPGAAGWTRAFQVSWAPRPARPARGEEKIDWRIVPLGEPALAAILQSSLGTGMGGARGVIVTLPATCDGAYLVPMLNAVQRAIRERAKRLVLVQRGGAAAPFFRSAALEYPAMHVAIVDVCPEHPDAAKWVFEEALSAKGFQEARYDATGLRHERVAKLVRQTQNVDFPLTPRDVVLVTGGGKGIGAECALWLARKSGARLAILGRSDPTENPELSLNLARMRDQGVECGYYRADVSIARGVRDAVALIRSGMGEPTIILHAAGVNTPASLASLSAEALERTLAPKVDGLRNVLEAVGGAGLRMVCAFGSIIAQTGLRGEADYAIANEWMARVLEGWAANNSHCRTLTIDWSVWAGAGMGERLGTLDSLMEAGITPISIEAGAAMLGRLLADANSPARVVVSGRTGGLPTLEYEIPPLPFLRFLEEPKLFTPEVELLAEAVLQSDSDPYLDEHVFEGERLMPAVVGLEAMAQLASALVAPGSTVHFEDVEFLRPIVGGVGREVRLRLAAVAELDGSVKTVIRCSHTNFAVDHFRAVCRFTEAKPPETRSAGLPVRNEPLAIEPVEDLYGGLLFQGGRFRRVTRYFEIHARSAEAEIDTTPGKGLWFGWHFPQVLLLGDPAIRDAALHSVQVCIPHATLLPVSVKRIEIFSWAHTGPVYCRSQETEQDGNVFTYNLEVRGSDGTLVETWEGLRLQGFDRARVTKRAWPQALLAPFLERRLGERAVEKGVRIAFMARGRREALLASLGVSGKEVCHRLDGKPELGESGKSITFSHLGEISMGAVALGEVACDLVAVQERPPAVWREMLGSPHYAVARFVAGGGGEESAVAASRVWAAMECLRKAGVRADEPLLMESHEGDWITFRAGNYTVATLPLEIKNVTGAVVAALLLRRYDAGLRIPACSGF